MIKCTPLKTIWGTALMDRNPSKVLEEIRRVYDPDKLGIDPKGHRRVVVMGDAVHPMSPFKGQGCNQALADGPLLRSWLERSALDAAVNGFMREMVDRTSVRVNASREAAIFLHSEAVLRENERFAGVKKDCIDNFLGELRKRRINAELGGDLDEEVSYLIKELKIHDTIIKPSKDGDQNIRNRALKLATSGDIAALRVLSISHASSIREAKRKDNLQGCLHLAASCGCYWTCRWLLSEIKCDYSQCDNRKRLPLHYAVMKGDIDSTRLLARLSKSSISHR